MQDLCVGNLETNYKQFYRCVYIYVCDSMFVVISMCLCVCEYLCICIYVCLCVCACMCICMCMCIYMCVFIVVCMQEVIQKTFFGGGSTKNGFLWKQLEIWIGFTYISELMLYLNWGKFVNVKLVKIPRLAVLQVAKCMRTVK